MTKAATRSIRSRSAFPITFDILVGLRDRFRGGVADALRNARKATPPSSATPPFARACVRSLLPSLRRDTDEDG